jgi:hypothetical protein
LTRRLVHVPILHTAADLGSLAANARDRGAADALWARLTKVVPFLPLPWDRVRLFQDGLPVCGREADIVHDLAAAGSVNHKLLLRLMSKGAALEGTEDPALLVEELHAARALLGSDPDVRDRAVAAAPGLLRRRDQAIAARIGVVLREGEVGLLFLGAAHDPSPFWPADLVVIGLEQAAKA